MSDEFVVHGAGREVLPVGQPRGGPVEGVSDLTFRTVDDAYEKPSTWQARAVVLFRRFSSTRKSIDTVV